jgi:hypothetical protein
VDGLLHAGFLRPLADLGADAVIRAMSDHRPAVVRACADDVHLVAALRPMLVRPQHPGLRVQRRALHVAVAERELLRLPARLARERIVVGHAAVVLGTEAVVSLRGIGKINQPIPGELRVRDDIVQPALPMDRRPRHARDGLRQQLALLDDPQAALLLRDEHASVGQESERPGLVQPLDQPHQAKLVVLGAEGLRECRRSNREEGQEKSHEGAHRVNSIIDAYEEDRLSGGLPACRLRLPRQR